MKHKLLISILSPLAITGGAILLRSIFPRLDASVALFVAGFAITFAALSINTSANGPKQ